MFHDHHGDARAVDAAHDLGNVDDDLGREPKRWFVEQQDPGSAHQRPADCDHLLFTARQTARQLRTPFMHAREIFVDTFQVFGEGLARASGVRTEPQVLVDGQVGEQPAAFRHKGDALRNHLVGGFTSDVLAVVNDLAAAGRNQARQASQRRRLSCAVCAENAGDGPLFEGEVHLVHGHDGPIVNREVL